MSYGIIRVEKVKAAAVGSMQYHNDRMPGAHSNEDIDHERTRDNAERVRHGSYRAEVNDRIARYRTSTRKVRKDAVVLCEGIATASPEFFEGKSRAEVLAFYDDVYAFCVREFGAQNIVHFTLHMDETTPHVHFGFVPIKDGSLSWKKFFDGKAGLSAFQDRYFESVCKGYGLQRGERSEESGRTHRDLKRMKRESSRELHALESNVRDARATADRAHDEARAAARELRALDAKRVESRGELAAIETEVEKKRARAAALDGELAEKTAAIGSAKTELAEIFSARDAAKRDVADATEEVMRMTGEADDANRERDAARVELEQLRADVVAARDELEQACANRDELAAEYEAIDDELVTMRSERQTLDGQIADLRREHRALTEELGKLRERVRTFVDAALAFVDAARKRGLGHALADLLAPASTNPLVADMFDRADEDVARGRVSASRYDDVLDWHGREVLNGEAQLIEDDAEWLGEQTAPRRPRHIGR